MLRTLQSFRNTGSLSEETSADPRTVLSEEVVEDIRRCFHQSPRKSLQLARQTDINDYYVYFLGYPFFMENQDIF